MELLGTSLFFLVLYFLEKSVNVECLKKNKERKKIQLKKKEFFYIFSF